MALWARCGEEDPGRAHAVSTAGRRLPAPARECPQSRPVLTEVAERLMCVCLGCSGVDGKNVATLRELEIRRREGEGVRTGYMSGGGSRREAERNHPVTIAASENELIPTRQRAG